MKPNSTGNFCDVCSKNVIDFTKLDPYGIATQLKKANGNMCARITTEQLNFPLPNLEPVKQYDLPYSNIAAGLMIATTLASVQPMQAGNQREKIEFAESSGLNITSKKVIRKASPNTSKPNDFAYLKGKITDAKDKPVENAKITFVTVEKLIIVYTLSDGSFSIEIPAHLIDNDNVIRVTYDKIKKENETKKNPFYGFETGNYILSKTEMASNYQITAQDRLIIMGEMGYSPAEINPVVIHNGVEINYKEFSKAQAGQKSSCNLENKAYLYFESKFAIAIYGEKAKDGLYILMDKTKK